MAQRLLDGLEQICERQVECIGNRLQGPQTGFLATLLKVRHEILVKSGLFGKINLTPSSLIPQLSNPLPKLDADVPCHHTMVGLKIRFHPLYSVVHCEICFEAEAQSLLLSGGRKW